MTKEEARKMLTNTKVYVNGNSNEIQEKLFEIGFKWIKYGSKISFLHAPFLFIEDDISYSISMQTFLESSKKEISADDILNIKIDEEFIPKKGDIIVTDGLVCISDGTMLNVGYGVYFAKLRNGGVIYRSDLKSFSEGCKEDIRISTEYEKACLLFELKKYGLYWNKETEELEKIVEPKQTHEFKPFDKVLVRNYEDDNWDIEFFQEIGGEDIDYQFVCLSGCFNFCIPYEGNEELLGTSNSPKE